MISAVLGGLDHAVWRFFVHHHFMVSFAKTYTRWGVSSVLIPLAVIIGITIFVIFRSALLAVIPMVSLQINDVLTAFSKSFFSVSRPPHAEWLAGAGGGSFPSGHMANTTALVIGTALVVASQVRSPRPRMLVIGVAAVLVSLMGWTRLALNVHWLSDVLAGWVLGTVCAAATAGAMLKLSEIAPTRQKAER